MTGGPYGGLMQTATRPIGDLLRDWRQRRHLSQLALANEADVSARHVSFLETGRAQPSREMLLRLSERLEIPLRERNGLLIAAGFAPVYAERPLDDPALAAAHEAVQQVLTGHEPYPALAIDRHWKLIAFNQTIPRLLTAVDPEQLKPPVNVLRLSLHPDGLAPQIVNITQWRAHLLERLRHQIEVSGDPVLAELMRELSGYPAPMGGSAERVSGSAVVVPLRLRRDDRILDLISTTTVFGTPVEITLSELAIESFFPANPETAESLRRLSSA